MTRRYLSSSESLLDYWDSQAGSLHKTIAGILRATGLDLAAAVEDKTILPFLTDKGNPADSKHSELLLPKFKDALLILIYTAGFQSSLGQMRAKDQVVEMALERVQAKIDESGEASAVKVETELDYLRKKTARLSKRVISLRLDSRARPRDDSKAREMFARAATVVERHRAKVSERSCGSMKSLWALRESQLARAVL